MLEIVQDISDPDGNGNPTYQWQTSDDGITNWSIVGTNIAYVLKEKDKTKQYAQGLLIMI